MDKWLKQSDTSGSFHEKDNRTTEQQELIELHKRLLLKEYILPEEKTNMDEVIGTATAPIYWHKPAAVTMGATFIVPYGVAGKGRLLHPVGLTYQAEVNQETGQKLTKITLADGSELDMDKIYTVAVSNLLIDRVTESNLKDCQVSLTGKYLKDVLETYIRNHKEVSPPEIGFEIEGVQPMYTFP